MNEFTWIVNQDNRNRRNWLKIKPSDKKFQFLISRYPNKIVYKEETHSFIWKSFVKCILLAAWYTKPWCWSNKSGLKRESARKARKRGARKSSASVSINCEHERGLAENDNASWRRQKTKRRRKGKRIQKIVQSMQRINVE